MTRLTITMEHDPSSNREFFVARDDEGNKVDEASAWEAITASSDSDAIAQAVVGHLDIQSVEHDGEHVHVTVGAPYVL